MAGHLFVCTTTFPSFLQGFTTHFLRGVGPGWSMDFYSSPPVSSELLSVGCCCILLFQESTSEVMNVLCLADYLSPWQPSPLSVNKLRAHKQGSFTNNTWDCWHKWKFYKESIRCQVKKPWTSKYQYSPFGGSKNLRKKHSEEFVTSSK